MSELAVPRFSRSELKDFASAAGISLLPSLQDGGLGVWFPGGSSFLARPPATGCHPLGDEEIGPGGMEAVGALQTVVPEPWPVRHLKRGDWSEFPILHFCLPGVFYRGATE